MPTLLEQQKKAAERRLKATIDAKEKAQRERQAGVRERRIGQAIFKRKAWLIGTRIVEAREAGEITPELLSGISDLLGTGELSAADKELLADYRLPPPAPVRPVLDKPDPVREAAE